MQQFYKRGAVVVGALTVLAGLVVASFRATTLEVTGNARVDTIHATSSLALGPTTSKSLLFLNSATSSLNFTAVPNGTCEVQTMTVTGAQASSTSPASVSLGYDPVFKSGYATTVNLTAWVSAYATVSVQACAGTSTAMMDPPALVFRSTVLNFGP